MKPDDLVVCSGCVNYKFPTELCFIENCQHPTGGPCKGCPCEHCDADCLDPDVPKQYSVRPKFYGGTLGSSLSESLPRN